MMIRYVGIGTRTLSLIHIYKLVKEMNYVLREREEQEEERFKRLDESLRAMQQKNKVRAEAAAAKAPVVKLKKKRFPFRKQK